ncbi:MAG: divalent-cation tolerance protein CutA [Candidatus Hydrothermarchaeales archaeon]
MYVTVYITTPDKEEAEKIGETIVGERLAACANIIPNMSSIYWWKDEMEKSDETVLLLKTKEENTEAIVRRVKELHSYENPCIVALPILKGSREYLEWIKEETKKG